MTNQKKITVSEWMKDRERERERERRKRKRERERERERESEREDDGWEDRLIPGQHSCLLCVLLK